MSLFGFPSGLSGGSKETSYLTAYGTNRTTNYNTNYTTSWNSTGSGNVTGVSDFENTSYTFAGGTFGTWGGLSLRTDFYVDLKIYLKSYSHNWEAFYRKMDYGGHHYGASQKALEYHNAPVQVPIQQITWNGTPWNVNYVSVVPDCPSSLTTQVRNEWSDWSFADNHLKSSFVSLQHYVSNPEVYTTARWFKCDVTITANITSNLSRNTYKETSKVTNYSTDYTTSHITYG